MIDQSKEELERCPECKSIRKDFEKTEISAKKDPETGKIVQIVLIFCSGCGHRYHFSGHFSDLQ